MKTGAIIVNSTLAAQTARAKGEPPPAFHHWGLEPGDGDLLVGHSLSTWSIRLRRLLGGTDPSVVAKVRTALDEGYRKLYLVTQPDLIRKLPALKRRHPDLAVVTWVWVPEEVARWKAGLSACKHVFALTEGARREMEKRLPDVPCTLEILGSDCGRYFLEGDHDWQVGLFGLANRDAETTRAALAAGGFSAVATRPVAGWLGADAPGVEFRDAAGFQAVFRMVARSGVCWVPTKKGDTYPTGLTNLVDSLLSGVPAIVSRTNPLPDAVLSLPGVHRYEPGSAEDLVRVTREVLGALPSRAEVRRAAQHLLDVRLLEDRIRSLLELPASTRTRLFW